MSPRDSDTPPPVPPPWKTGRSPFAAIAASGGALLLFALLIGLPIFIWFFCRIEPEKDAIAILVRKTGVDLPEGDIIATAENQKGIRLAVLPEGRYFKNPYTWSWIYAKVVDIPAGRLGVQTRLFGKPLPSGEILAKDGTQGIIADILTPGKYRVNPYAYDVKILDAIAIRPGHVGVVTHLTGQDVLNDDLPATVRNTFLVSNALKGVVNEVLDPGTYYLNPYMYDVREVNLQSQRFEMSGDDAINFLTLDGFAINVEGTIEFGISRESASLLTHRIGDMDDVLKKIILPRARGFSRLEGSKYPANNFIVGETRQLFQNNLEKHLRERCESWGVLIKSVLIRNISPPEEIAKVIREREVAVQNAKKFAQQIEQSKSKAELTKQEMLAEQNKEKVKQDTLSIKAVIKAKQEQAVALAAANRQLEVAKLETEAAKAQAQAKIAQATAERDVIRMKNEASAAVLGTQVGAFGNGDNYARYTLYQKLAPRIDSVLTSDGKDGLGSVIVPARPAAKEVQP